MVIEKKVVKETNEVFTDDVPLRVEKPNYDARVQEMNRDVLPESFDPYDIEGQVAPFLQSSTSEKQLHEYIKRIIKHTIKHYDILTLNKIIDYLSGRYDIRKSALDTIVSNMSHELRVEERKTLPVVNFKLDNFMENVEAFYQKQPFFYDDVQIFWLWKVDHWEMVDETDLLNILEDCLYIYGQTIKSSIKNMYLEAMKRLGRKKKPKDAPCKWVQFKDKAYSLESGNVYDVTPDYFFTNPIPWELAETSHTPIMDKLVTEWVGEKYLQTIYEVIAYCCYAEYPIQTVFCLYGHGRNGKSCLIRLMSKFVGMKNLCSTELDMLTGSNSSRFETFKLYKKLVCLMGETNFGVMSHSSMLKRLCGGDVIGFEKKGKDPFDDFSYAKLIIASNSLPISEDTSEGFYRRWVIIDFPNEFPEGRDILKDIPETEYNALAKKCAEILPDLLKRGVFTNQGMLEERKEKYIMASNPLPKFLKIATKEDYHGFTNFNELFTDYLKFLQINKKRRVSRKEFTLALQEEGYWGERTKKKINNDFVMGNWVDGIILVKDWEKGKNSQISHFSSNIIPQKIGNIGKVRSSVKSEKNIQDSDNSLYKMPENYINWRDDCIIHTKCEKCDETETNELDDGKLYCRKHFDEIQQSKN